MKSKEFGRPGGGGRTARAPPLNPPLGRQTPSIGRPHQKADTPQNADPPLKEDTLPHVRMLLECIFVLLKLYAIILQAFPVNIANFD